MCYDRFMVKTINTIQAAAILNCTQKYVQRLCRSKQIKAIKHPLRIWNHPAYWEIDLNSLLSWQRKDHELADSFLSSTDRKNIKNLIRKL